ncbi:MAG: hypothetical protein GYA24_02880 [Candidatus Lokiarchaeota archaeon]|nr:hypothetical protein [Candidatus Lokiarchaeota archaeon]
MSKMRKSVVKQQERSQGPKKPQAPRPSAAATDASARDNFLYNSAIRSYVLAVVFFLAAVLSAGSFWPFDALRGIKIDASNPDSATLGATYGIAFDIITGVLCLALFLFLTLAWGNALEIRGSVIEWKHLLICIIVVVIIAAWGGLVGFGIFIFGAFLLLTYMWYAVR